MGDVIKTKLSLEDEMAVCTHCGKKELMPFKCKFCGELYCSNHRLPENHECLGLKSYKEEWRMKPEKWVYEPFQEKRAPPVGRRIKEPIPRKIERFIKNLNTRQILYFIVVVIIILTIYEGLK